MTARDTADEHDALRLRIAQTAPRRGAVEANAREMFRLLRSASADAVDLLVFPELALTGYDLGSRAADLAIPADEDPWGLWTDGKDGPVVIYGFVERGGDHLVYNSATVAAPGRRLHTHRKLHLPTYGTFDEGRIFAPGRAGVDVFEVLPKWTTAVLVCEDLWHPPLPYLAGLRGIDLLVVPAAAPGREPPTSDAPTAFASVDAWETIARATALIHGIWLVVANRSGVEGPVTFAGSSFVVAPDGTVVRRLGTGEETSDLVLHRSAIREARATFSHLRDARPGRVQAELARLTSRDRGRP